MTAESRRTGPKLGTKSNYRASIRPEEVELEYLDKATKDGLAAAQSVTTSEVAVPGGSVIFDSKGGARFVRR